MGGGYHWGDVLGGSGLGLGFKEVVADGLIDSTSPVLLHEDIPTVMDNSKSNMQAYIDDHLLVARVSLYEHNSRSPRRINHEKAVDQHFPSLELYSGLDEAMSSSRQLSPEVQMDAI